MARFTLQYTTPVANALATEWARRMEHYFQIYLAANSDDFAYSEEQIQSYSSTTEWQNLVRSLKDKRALARAQGIDAIAPTNP